MMSKFHYAQAVLKGSAAYPRISGLAVFEETESGTAVSIAVKGLPAAPGKCSRGIFAVHIHSGASCSGSSSDPFADAGGHYDTADCSHPFHSGDMPPLFAAGDRAAMSFLTDRFSVKDVIGRTVIIHLHPDDLHSQPSGMSGEKIACGVIKAAMRE